LLITYKGRFIAKDKFVFIASKFLVIVLFFCKIRVQF